MILGGFFQGTDLTVNRVDRIALVWSAQQDNDLKMSLDDCAFKFHCRGWVTDLFSERKYSLGPTVRVFFVWSQRCLTRNLKIWLSSSFAYRQVITLASFLTTSFFREGMWRN